jgi:DNA polymerase-3 subunit gamma/tau
MESGQAASTHAKQYVVVARRYRPQAFGELVGQEHVAQALSNAIDTKRIGHAYLFIGVRGTGKTSTARILAKALNCAHGPTATPCNECDICRSISAGDDVDVLEIDGASNNGIDEIRQLRQNANIRPSRARFKIYIIDEVHMLSTAAFNGLLKTLEEPPEHVKFIFCTTEARKIPITILSRCQRFDFAGISTRSIHERLRQIVEAEGVQAEPEALEVIARRAANSMRDGQSLLEQLLAFAPEKITVADVHGMLGTAGDERLGGIVGKIVGRDSAGALAELDAAAREGVDVTQLIEQLFGYFRDCMVAAVGCPAESFLYASPGSGRDVIEAGKQLGLQTVLAAMQILDHALSRMRVSTQARVLAELALVRISHLEELDELATWLAQMQSGQLPSGPAVSAAVKKNGESARLPSPSGRGAGGEGSASDQRTTIAGSAANAPHPSRLPKGEGTSGAVPTAPRQPAVVLTPQNARQVWCQALDTLSGVIIEQARQCEGVRLSAPNRLIVSFTNAMTRSMCQRPEQVAKFERALAEVAGQTVRVEFEVIEGQPSAQAPAVAPRPVSSHQRLMEAAKHPMIQRAVELFGAHPVRVEE